MKAIVDKAILAEEMPGLLDQMGIHHQELLDAVRDKTLKGYVSQAGEFYFRAEEIEAWWNRRCEMRARLS